MDRKKQYKKQYDQDELRLKRHQLQLGVQKTKRFELVDCRRARLDVHFEGTVSQEQVLEACQNLLKKKERLCSLQNLRRAFADDIDLIEHFMRMSGCLPSVVGLLTGSDSSLQLEAAWLLTNLAAGPERYAMQVVKQAGAYLVTYLSASHAALQDQCAWAIGNLAGAGQKLRNLLRKQGAEKALVDLLSSPDTSVLMSAAFALRNMAQDVEHNRNLVVMGVFQNIGQCIKENPSNIQILTQFGWTLSYLTADISGDEVVLLKSGLPPIMMQGFTFAVQQENIQLITSFLRGCGNVFANLNQVQDLLSPSLAQALTYCFTTPAYPHLRVEAAWVLYNISCEPAGCEWILQSGLVQKSGLSHLILNNITSCHSAPGVQMSLGCVNNLVTWLPSSAGAASSLAIEVVSKLPVLLYSPHRDVVTGAIQTLELLLYIADDKATLKEKFQQQRGLEALQALSSGDDKTIAEMAGYVQRQYFGDNIEAT